MFFDNIQLSNPLVMEWKTGASEEHDLHAHDALEIHILRENEARFATVGKIYDGKPGDVFLFRPSEPHWNLAKDRNKPIRWISIVFSPAIVHMLPEGARLLYPFYAVWAVSPYIPAGTACARRVHRLAGLAMREQEERQLNWESRQFALFIDILVHILRHSTQHGSKEAADVDEGVLAGISYLLRNFTRDIDMEAVVKLSGKKRTYFYDKFKAVIGVTPNHFVRRLRMQVALHLLAHTDLSVTAIAFECGYQSLHYFIKHFRQYRNMSPLAYRKSVRASRRLAEKNATFGRKSDKSG